MISTVSDLLAQVESSGDMAAVRFEPAHAPADKFVSRMMDVAKCSDATARILCACSWGLYQIMGDELMALGLSFSPIVYCQTKSSQDYMLRLFLVEKGLAMYSLDDIINSTVDRTHFATKYNGPGNVPAYSQRLLDVYAKNK